ncbi:SRPBCC family protein [Chloroflexota bacterium]
MAKIEEAAIVNAPIERIFRHINEPSNWLEFWPSLVEIKDVQSLPNGGYRARWVYKMAGMRFKGKGEYTDVAPNHWLVIKTKGGIRSTITWTFRSIGEKTRVTLTIEYKVPILLLGKLAEAIVVKMNEQEANLIMHNLQIRFIMTNR